MKDRSAITLFVLLRLHFSFDAESAANALQTRIGRHGLAVGSLTYRQEKVLVRIKEVAYI